MDEEVYENVVHDLEPDLSLEFRNDTKIALRVILSFGLAVLSLLICGLLFFFLLLTPSNPGGGMMQVIPVRMFSIFAFFGITHSTFKTFRKNSFYEGEN
jgi:F0F1-type ATP synthase assembly protein I